MILSMQHVFVETNWVVGYAAPAHRRQSDAEALLARAGSGALRLYLPSVCLTEARATIVRKFQPRNEADAVRRFLAWAGRKGEITVDEAGTTRRVLDKFEHWVRTDLEALSNRLDSLRQHPGLEIFAPDDEILERAVTLGATDIELKPFDQVILAAVLVRAERLRAEGASEICFCELDADLQPWDRKGNAKPTLTHLYDEAGIWVYGDFELLEPERPPNWGP